MSLPSISSGATSSEASGCPHLGDPSSGHVGAACRLSSLPYLMALPQRAGVSAASMRPRCMAGALLEAWPWLFEEPLCAEKGE